jgi:hypothetical protein
VGPKNLPAGEPLARILHHRITEMMAIAAALSFAGSWTVGSTDVDFRFAGKLGWRVMETVELRQGSREIRVSLDQVRHTLKKSASPSYAPGETVMISSESDRLTRFQIKRG